MKFHPISVAKMESENMKEALNFYSIYDEYFIHLFVIFCSFSSRTQWELDSILAGFWLYIFDFM